MKKEAVLGMTHHAYPISSRAPCCLSRHHAGSGSVW